MSGDISFSVVAPAAAAHNKRDGTPKRGDQATDQGDQDLPQPRVVLRLVTELTA